MDENRKGMNDNKAIVLSIGLVVLAFITLISWGIIAGVGGRQITRERNETIAKLLMDTKRTPAEIRETYFGVSDEVRLIRAGKGE